MESATLLIAQRNLAEAEATLRRALEVKPDSFDARLNLSGLFLQAGQLDLAEQWSRKALQVEPHNPSAHFNLALCLRLMEKTAEAVQHLEHVCLLVPRHKGAQLELAILRLNICDWSRRARDEQTIRGFFEDSSNEELSYEQTWTLNQITPDAELQSKVARRVAEGMARGVDVARTRCNFQYDLSTPERIKVGYVSPDFRRHAVGSLIHGMFKHHNRERFEIHAYSLKHADDVIHHEIKRDCEYFHEVEKESPEALAKRIHADGIHILVDLAGYTTFTKPETFALRPAPIQLQYLGFLNTMGADWYDYTIADSVVMTDELAADYTEEIVYMPNSFMLMSGFDISTTTIARSDVGLPEDTVVFCSFNTPYKLDPSVFDSWSRILLAVPNSVLWLYVNENALAENNIRIEVRQRGIDESRIMFATRMEPAQHLARIALADLFLDTFVYNAGATAAGALYAGLPVLTRFGTTVLSRMGSSMLRATGLEELICYSAEEYERIAIELGNDPERLRAIRQTLHRDPVNAKLFDTHLFMRNLESAYETMWQNRLEGIREPIQVVDVSSGFLFGN